MFFFLNTRVPSTFLISFCDLLKYCGELKPLSFVYVCSNVKSLSVIACEYMFFFLNTVW